MAAALQLVGNVLRGQVPARALLWGLLNRLNYHLRTGDRRYEFERLYAEAADPWGYHTRPDEWLKYDRALAAALQWRPPGAERALEVGCSVGVFTRMLSERFGDVTAIDIAETALDRARANNRGRTNIDYRRAHLQSLDLGTRFDVITCAEVLCYIAEKDAAAVCAALRRHLAPDGVVIVVAATDQPSKGFFEFNDWKPILEANFQLLHQERFDDPQRPYEISVLRSPA